MANSTFNVDVVQCFDCDFIQTEPGSAARLSHYYSTDYRKKSTKETINSMRAQSGHQAEAQVANKRDRPTVRALFRNRNDGHKTDPHPAV